MQKLLQFKLRVLAKMYLWRYKPVIVAVTGNAGKSSTKEAVGAVVSAISPTRVAGGNLNNEIGVPLAIVGDWGREYYEHGSSLSFWINHSGGISFSGNPAASRMVGMISLRETSTLGSCCVASPRT